MLGYFGASELSLFSALRSVHGLPPEFRELSPSYRAANPAGTARWIELEKAARVANAPPPRPGGADGDTAVTFATLGALKVPMILVTPQKWKRHFRLIGSDKEASRTMALRLFPACAEHFQRKKDHGRAEAALLARYGAETFGGAS